MSVRAQALGRRLITLLLGSALFLAYALLAVPGQARAAATISLSPGHGAAGDRVTAFGDGFGACLAPVDVTFDSAAVGSDTSGGDHFRVTFTVPASAAPGPHDVVARCANVLAQRAGEVSPVEFPGRALSVSATFTVDARTKADPAIVLDTTRGRAGDALRITGTGYLCADLTDVELRWDGGGVLGTVTVDGEGRFSTTVEVPADAEAGQHEVRAVCTGDSAVQDGAVFTVLPAESNGGTDGSSSGNGNGGTNGGGSGSSSAGSGGNGGTDSGGNGTGLHGSGSDGPSVGLVVGPALGAVVLAAAAATYFRRHRAPRTARARVTASLLPVAPADVDVRVTEPGNHDRPTRTVRLEPRADPGTRSIEEQET